MIKMLLVMKNPIKFLMSLILKGKKYRINKLQRKEIKKIYKNEISILIVLDIKGHIKINNG